MDVICVTKTIEFNKVAIVVKKVYFLIRRKLGLIIHGEEHLGSVPVIAVKTRMLHHSIERYHLRHFYAKYKHQLQLIAYQS